MARNHRKQTSITCPICNASKRPNQMVHGEMIRPQVAELIQKDHPAWTSDDWICLACAGEYRVRYVRKMLEEESGELTDLQRNVIESIRQHEIMSENINATFEQKLTFGERLSDHIADFGGSWTFIISFGLVLAVWIGINTVALFREPFDPFPFILLNLVLSCLAAIQAPIIMMSQNRQEAKDRLRSEFDYQINLKAELEIRILSGKIDQLITHQWRRLLEIQEIQMEMLEQTTGKPPVRNHEGTSPSQ